MSKHYAVFGHPVAHSLSPRIHVAFGRQTGIAIDYRAHDAAPSGFADALSDFAAHGGAFPLLVRGVGPVGTVVVSGLPQVEDHRMVVAALREHLARG